MKRAVRQLRHDLFQFDYASGVCMSRIRVPYSFQFPPRVGKNMHRHCSLGDLEKPRSTT
jgi:hypothetical protein